MGSPQRDSLNTGLRAVLGGSEWATASDKYSDIPALKASVQWSDPEDSINYWEAPAVAQTPAPTPASGGTPASTPTPAPTPAPTSASGGTPASDPTQAPAGSSTSSEDSSATHHGQGFLILLLVAGFLAVEAH